MAKAENFEVSEEEYTDEIKRMADAYHMELDKLTEMLSSFEEKAIREDLCIKKALDFAVENAVEK